MILISALYICNAVTDPYLRWLFWVAVKEFELNHHKPETMLFTTFPSYGKFNKFLNSNPVLGPMTPGLEDPEEPLAVSAVLPNATDADHLEIRSAKDRGHGLFIMRLCRRPILNQGLLNYILHIICYIIHIIGDE